MANKVTFVLKRPNVDVPFVDPSNTKYQEFIEEFKKIPHGDIPSVLSADNLTWTVTLVFDDAGAQQYENLLNQYMDAVMAEEAYRENMGLQYNRYFSI